MKVSVKDSSKELKDYKYPRRHSKKDMKNIMFLHPLVHEFK